MTENSTFREITDEMGEGFVVASMAKFVGFCDVVVSQEKAKKLMS